MKLKKKKFFFFLFLLCFGYYLYAQEDYEVTEFDEISSEAAEPEQIEQDNIEQDIAPSDILMTEVKEWDLMDPSEDTETDAKPETPETPPIKQPEKKKGYGLTDRSFELGFNANVNAANNFISAMDIVKRPISILVNLKDIINKDFRIIYRDDVVINIDEFFKGFKFDFNTDANVLVRYYSKNKWGWGLDIGDIDVIGNVSLPQEMLKLEEGKDIKAGFGGAAFAGFGIPVYFHVNDFKIKLKPAVYMPLFYLEPGVTYNFVKSSQNGRDGMRLSANYNVDIYSPAKMENGDFGKAPDYLKNNYQQILKENLGYDLGFGLEYKLNSWLNIGADIVNVPFYPAKLYDYLKIHGEVFFDTSYIDINEVINQGEDYEIPEDAYGYPEDFEILSAYNKNGKRAFRPFKMIFYGNIQVFEKPILTFVPSLGFSVSRVYVKKAAMEGGLTGILNLRNIFLLKGGINYNNRIWINSLDFILNIRALELNIGISSQSQQLKKSFNYSGVGVNVGVKLGF